MQIYGPYRVSTTQSTSEVQRTSAPERTVESDTSTNSGPVDQLDLSQAAAETAGASGASPLAGEGIRFERVADIRRQIAQGTYDSPEKMDAALNRFLDMMG